MSGTIIGAAPLAVRNGLPQAPWDIQDEVELYAREHDRTAKLHFVPVGGWMVRFSLRCNDARVKLFQQGEVPEPPTEDVWFHEPNPRSGEPTGRGGREPPYLPLDILQMGPSGVRTFLERGNTWSGRGEFPSVVEAVERTLEKDDANAARFRATQKEASLNEQREKRRFRYGIPVVPVAVDLKKES